MKIRYIILIFSIFFIFSACSKNGSPITPTLIKPTATPGPISSGTINFNFMFKIDFPQAIISKDTNSRYVSFLTTTELSCLASDEDEDNLNDIGWEITGGTDWSISDPKQGTGFGFKFQPSQVVSSDFSAQRNKAPLDFTIKSILKYHYYDSTGPKIVLDPVQVEITQDNIHALRQEYLDMYTALGVADGVTPGRDEFENKMPVNSELLQGLCTNIIGGLYRNSMEKFRR